MLQEPYEKATLPTRCENKIEFYHLMTRSSVQATRSRQFKTLDITSDGLGDIFEGDSADTCAEKFPLMSMGVRLEGLVCANQGARTPIGVRGNFSAETCAKKIPLMSKGGRAVGLACAYPGARTHIGVSRTFS